MKKLFIFTVSISMFAMIADVSAQDRSSTNKSSQQRSLSLMTPDVGDGPGLFVCSMQGLNVTREGIGYYCVTPKSIAQSKKTYLFVINPSNQLDIPTAIDFLNSRNAAQYEIATRFKAPSKKSERICNLVMGAKHGPVICQEVISMGWQRKLN